MFKETSRSEVDQPGRDNWRAGWVWLAYTLLFGFMPLSLGVLGLWIRDALGFSRQGAGWSDFLNHGELLIYAASLAAAATRLISSDVNPTRPFLHRQVFNLLGYAVILPSAAGYAMIKVLSLSSAGAQIDVQFMISFSVPMVMASVLFSVLVFVLDHHRTTTPVNLTAQIKREEDELSENFDRVEESKLPSGPKPEEPPNRSSQNA
jgi:hypothetical protein